MPMTREGRGSLTFLLTCVDCEGTLRVATHDGSGFSAARIAATRRGWTFVKSLDRCGGCTKAATPAKRATPKRKPAAKR